MGLVRVFFCLILLTAVFFQSTRVPNVWAYYIGHCQCCLRSLHNPVRVTKRTVHMSPSAPSRNRSGFRLPRTTQSFVHVISRRCGTAGLFRLVLSCSLLCVFFLLQRCSGKCHYSACPPSVCLPSHLSCVPVIRTAQSCTGSVSRPKRPGDESVGCLSPPVATPSPALGCRCGFLILTPLVLFILCGTGL